MYRKNWILFIAIRLVPCASLRDDVKTKPASNNKSFNPEYPAKDLILFKKKSCQKIKDRNCAIRV